MDASGSLASYYLIKATQEAGYFAIASDIDSGCYAKVIADDFIEMPLNSDKNLWFEIETELKEHKIDLVIPSLDETLYGWASRKEYFKRKGIFILISDVNTLNIFQDKWLTYNFFINNGIPTPTTSIKQDYNFIKPRFGRGSVGIQVATEAVDMTGNISQEYIVGTEYTIDVLCDKEGIPVYIVPRTRLNVKEGKSTAGIVIKHSKIEEYVKRICSEAKFTGPINIQCIETDSGDIKFIEINPRIAGGMALGFAATENWIKLIVDHFVHGEEIIPAKVKHGMKMMRYYNEVFTME